MNPTMVKFGFPATLLKDYDHWAVLLRPSQVTLGSLVLAAKSDATAYHQLSREAFAEQADAVADIERALGAFVRFEKINYLMLMMVDPNIHFHVIPRYSDTRGRNGIDFPDAGWPGPPDLKSGRQLSEDEIALLVGELAPLFG
jgi:diadenosine tetraphosphate (Ap4A) HIT family hydrolase